MFKKVDFVPCERDIPQLNKADILRVFGCMPIDVVDAVPEKFHINKFGHRATDVSLYINAQNQNFADSVLRSIEVRAPENLNADKTVDELFNEFVPASFETPSEAQAFFDVASKRFAIQVVDKATKVADLKRAQIAKQQADKVKSVESKSE